MPSVTEDTLEGVGTAGWNSRAGFTQPRVFTVSDYTAADARARSLNVMELSGIPANNSPHPAFNWNDLIVISKSVETLSGSQFRVTCNYGIPEAGGFLPEPSLLPADGILTVSSTLVETESQFDIDDEQIFTDHFETNEQVPKRVYDSVKDHAVSMIVRYERSELGSPIDKALTHVGRLNSAGVFGDLPRTWLCSELSGTTTDGGIVYKVSYEFIRSPKVNLVGVTNVVQPWDATIVEIDPKTGTFVKNPVQGRGKKTIKVKGESDFTQLALTL